MVYYLPCSVFRSHYSSGSVYGVPRLAPQVLSPFHMSRSGIIILSLWLVWAATTKDKDYIRMQGYKHLVDDPVHRKEVVAGSLGEHLTKRTLLLVTIQ